MSRVTTTWLHKKGICCVSGKTTDNTLRLNLKDGVCPSSSIIYVCPDLVEKQWIGDNLFVFIDRQVFWEINQADMDVISPVKNTREFEYLVHQEERNVINNYHFQCEYY